MRRTVLVAALVVLAPCAAQAGGSAAAGAQIFSRCAMCHSNTKGGPSMIGPNLFGVVGRMAGSEPGYSYSPAMRKAGFVWTDDKLNAYVKAPSAVVPGNKMAFAGLPSDSQRADLIAYLDTLK